MCHNINRVCYVFGRAVRETVTEVTPTYLTSMVISTLREADFLVNKVLLEQGCYKKLAQMPVVLIPIHFDRDSTQRIPSCQRSIVLRPFISQDFMTGLPAIPDNHIPHEVYNFFFHRCCRFLVPAFGSSKSRDEKVDSRLPVLAVRFTGLWVIQKPGRKVDDRSRFKKIFFFFF